MNADRVEEVAANRHSGRARIVFSLATLIVGLALMELVAFCAVKFVLLTRTPALFFHPPRIIESELQQYLEVRDPLLGWPARAEKVISRTIPAYPKEGGECISLYGDSFTYGDDVGDAEAWSNLLSVQLGCRVANYGVGGYGTDQAFLRYAKNGNDRSGLVMLGIFLDNLIRNVNQYRYFLDGVTVFSLKPRFIVDDDQLKLVAIPIKTAEEFRSAISDPVSAFTNELFLPDSRNGPVTPSFPYLGVITQLLMSERFSGGLRGRPSWESFFREDHPSHALGITVAIAQQFADLCRSRGQECLVIIYPTGRSFKRFKESDHLATRSLGEQLERHGMPYVDLHYAFRARVGAEEFCGLLVESPAVRCMGHFNAAGNRLVADILYQHLVRQGFRRS
ncbi:MAG: hypothetical protein OEV01_15295 [Nitrospira sp.]|nr:hypothetical protein [Nitrospira sp.]